MRKVTVQGFLYDEKSSYLKGPALAPPLIRLTYNSPSANYFAENGFEVHPETLEDKGDFEIGEYLEIASITETNFEQKQPILTLGGDHSITYPVVKTIHNHYSDFELLHIDAHADLYDIFDGDRYSHACTFARIMEEDLVSGLTQIGIRSLNDHQREQAERYGTRLIEMKDFKLETLPAFKKPLYVSVDLDALDPAFAPGVSHQEPGGLSMREVISIIQKIEVPIVGADIMEYNPNRDIHGVTAMVASKILKEIVSKMLEYPL